jgi:hypothetical protein
MRISSEKLKELCRDQKMPLRDVLDQAGVSRTAYYSLVKKESVLPKSIGRVARKLGVSPLCFLVDETSSVRRIRELQAQAETVCRRYPECDRDVVFRTLMNQDLPPVERLRKALIRAPRPYLHQ